MIALTRLNKERLLVNPDLIKFVEQAPDTVITLLAGEKILVSESADEVIAKIMAFRRSLVPGVAHSCADRRDHQSGAQQFFQR